jgi:hypothetical protein
MTLITGLNDYYHIIRLEKGFNDFNHSRY